MIFLRYESLKQYWRLYPVTSIILLLQIIMFAIVELNGSSRDPQTLLRFGAMFALPGLEPEYWRYFSSIFLHIGFDHLLFNSFALFVFAPPLEMLLGKIKYILFYLGSGFSGNVLSHLLHDDVYYSAGASGAIYGIFAAFLFIGLFRKHLLDEQSRKTINVMLGIGLIYSIIFPQINLYGHLGGLLGGFLIFWLMAKGGGLKWN
jgi:rhomboid protease GluP